MGWFSKKKKEPPPGEHNFEGGVALIGRRAMVQNLQAKPELNGLPCKLVGWHPADPVDPTTANRFEVDVVGAGLFKLKQSNLKMLQEEDLLGKSVEISGLQGRADLNGGKGQVLRWVQDSGRYELLMQSGEKAMVKQANLHLPGEVKVKKGR